MRILDKLRDDKSPYLLQMLGIYLSVVFFLSLFFGLLPLVVGLGADGMVRLEFLDEPQSVSEFLWNWANFANAAGFLAIGIRIVHDIFKKAID